MHIRIINVLGIYNTASLRIAQYIYYFTHYIHIYNEQRTPFGLVDSSMHSCDTLTCISITASAVRAARQRQWSTAYSYSGVIFYYIYSTLKSFWHWSILSLTLPTQFTRVHVIIVTSVRSNTILNAVGRRCWSSIWIRSKLNIYLLHNLKSLQNNIFEIKLPT